MSTVLLSGASGFIGSHLTRTLIASGHQVARLVRPQSRSADAQAEVRWDPAAGYIDGDALTRLQATAVVNLAGAPLDRRWTSRRRREIRDSRVLGTRLLAQAIARLQLRPEVLLSGSAIGYYGADHGDEILDEESAVGGDFLARTAQEWEQATEPARTGGIRVVNLRTGLVLGRDGGLLRRILLPFRMGIGGRLGSGKQWMSWIALEDYLRALTFLMEAKTVSDAVNLVAPAPVRNDEFTRILARALGRPAILPVPATALELIFGDMALNTALASQRVEPKRIAGAGFDFRHPLLDEALRFELRRSDGPADR